MSVDSAMKGAETSGIGASLTTRTAECSFVAAAGQCEAPANARHQFIPYLTICTEPLLTVTFRDCRVHGRPIFDFRRRCGSIPAPCDGPAVTASRSDRN